MLSSTLPTKPVLPRMRTFRPRKISEGDNTGAGAGAAPTPVEECCIGPASIAPGPGFPAGGAGSVETAVANPGRPAVRGVEAAVAATRAARVRGAGGAAGDRHGIAAVALVADSVRQGQALTMTIARLPIGQRRHATAPEGARRAATHRRQAPAPSQRAVVTARRRGLHRAASGPRRHPRRDRKTTTDRSRHSAAHAGTSAAHGAAETVLAEAARAIGRRRATHAEREGRGVPTVLSAPPSAPPPAPPPPSTVIVPVPTPLSSGRDRHPSAIEAIAASAAAHAARLLRAIVSRHDAPSGAPLSAGRAPTVDQAFQRAPWRVSSGWSAAEDGGDNTGAARAAPNRSRSAASGPPRAGAEFQRPRIVSPTATLSGTRSASTRTRC